MAAALHQADHALHLLVAILYGSISPLAQPFAFLYFAVALLVERHNILHVYAEPYQSGGLCPAAVPRRLI